MCFQFPSLFLSKVVNKVCLSHYGALPLCQINVKAVSEKLVHLLFSFCCSFFVFAFWEFDTVDHEAGPSGVLFETINFSCKYLTGAFG